MTGVGVSWSAPAWVGQSDKDYSDLIRKKAEAVTIRDKRRGGKYSVREANTSKSFFPQSHSHFQVVFF